jgi:hypothetical protein
MGFRVTLNWQDMTHVGQVDTRMASPSAVGEQGGVQVAVGAMKNSGVIGWGMRALPQNAPGWMRQNLAAQPKNPHDGRPLVAIPLGGIDPNWTQGAMGQWVRMYRPDLLGGGPGYPQQGYPVQQPQQGYPPPGYPPAGSQYPHR